MQKRQEAFRGQVEFTTGPVELNEMISRNDNINIMDVGKSEDYAKGHVPGAISLPKESWPTFAGLSRNRVNIVYCYSEVCHFAGGATKYFAEHDFPVTEPGGGSEGWKQHNLPIAT